MPPAALLVVDDQDAIRHWVAAAFDGRFVVYEAPNGDDGLALARRHRPALILLDLMMPRMTGMEMLRALQEDPETRWIPVLLLTASQLDDETAKQLRAEPNVRGMLVKPCGVDALLAAVEAALKG